MPEERDVEGVGGGARTAATGRPSTSVDASQIWILRERVLKVAVWVERLVRRIVLHLPLTFPGRDAWQQLAHALSAT